MNEVCHQLTIASIDELESHPTNQYDTIISVCQDRSVDNVSDDIEYRHFPVADGCDSEYNWGGEYSFELFDDAVRSLTRSLFNDERVLIHCHKGRNRSVSIAMAAYAIWRDTTFSDAYRKVMNGQDKEAPDHEMRAFARHSVAGSMQGYPQ